MKGRISVLAFIVSSLLLALPAHGYEAGQWIYRMGVGTVVPDDKNLVLDETTYVEVDSGTGVTLNVSYFFTPHLALEVLAAFPFNHDIKLVEDGARTKVADTNHLPPTVSLQYHFLPEGNVQPYIGVGGNFTTFFTTETISDLSDEGIELELDNSTGFAAQLGADFLLGDDWLFNADVRYIDIETDAKLGGVEIGTVAIDPWVYSVSIGYRF